MLKISIDMAKVSIDMVEEKKEHPTHMLITTDLEQGYVKCETAYTDSTKLINIIENNIHNK